MMFAPIAVLVFALPAMVQNSPAAPSPWVQNWIFYEAWQVEYGNFTGAEMLLKISQESGSIKATLDMDGYGASTRICTDCLVVGDKISFFYSAERPGHTGPKFEKGDLLFELRRTGKQVITSWNSIKPKLDGNKKPGIHFVIDLVSLTSRSTRTQPCATTVML